MFHIDGRAYALIPRRRDRAGGTSAGRAHTATLVKLDGGLPDEGSFSGFIGPRVIGTEDETVVRLRTRAGMRLHHGYPKTLMFRGLRRNTRNWCGASSSGKTGGRGRTELTRLLGEGRREEAACGVNFPPRAFAFVFFFS